MSTKTLIKFDASIRNGLVGIGIYDFTNKRKITKSVNTNSKKLIL